MGRIRQLFIKRAASEVYEKFREQFSADFENNKKILAEVAKIDSKMLRNRMAGYITNLVRLKQKGARAVAPSE
ncbi:MAG: 30S ribosomal protein S17e [Euryarchaeota archaeon]|nr:30S ribosomal protein S17e [Euryarchaeota archaeon]